MKKVLIDLFTIFHTIFEFLYLYYFSPSYDTKTGNRGISIGSEYTWRILFSLSNILNKSFRIEHN